MAKATVWHTPCFFQGPSSLPMHSLMNFIQDFPGQGHILNIGGDALSWAEFWMFVCLYVCMYVCSLFCMYVCMYVCIKYGCMCIVSCMYVYLYLVFTFTYCDVFKMAIIQQTVLPNLSYKQDIKNKSFNKHLSQFWLHASSGFFFGGKFFQLGETFFFFSFFLVFWVGYFWLNISHGWSPLEQAHKIGRKETLVGVCHLI